MTLRTACRVAGILSLASLLLYAFAGVAVWALVPPLGEEGSDRGPLLAMIHLSGLCAGLVSIVDLMWE